MWWILLLDLLNDYWSKKSPSWLGHFFDVFLSVDSQQNNTSTKSTHSNINTAIWDGAGHPKPWRPFRKVKMGYQLCGTSSVVGVRGFPAQGTGPARDLPGACSSLGPGPGPDPARARALCRALARARPWSWPRPGPGPGPGPSPWPRLQDLEAQDLEDLHDPHDLQDLEDFQDLHGSLDP